MPNSSTHPTAAKSDAVTPASDGSSPGDTATEATDDPEQGDDRNNEPDLPPLPGSSPMSRNPIFQIDL